MCCGHQLWLHRCWFVVRHVYTWYNWMLFRIWFLNQFQVKRINAHWCTLAHPHYSICIESGCISRWAAFGCHTLQRRKKCNHVQDSWKNGSTGSTPRQARFIKKALAKPKKTCCVKMLRLFEKCSSRYTAVRFCKSSCMSVEKRTMYTASWGERSLTNTSKYRFAPTVQLRNTGFHERFS